MQVDVNGTNVGVGVIGLIMEVEVDGLGPDVVTVPAQLAMAGGVSNPNRGVTEKVAQAADRIKFVMGPGRGQGLAYRLVVRDQLRYVFKHSVVEHGELQHLC